MRRGIWTTFTVGLSALVLAVPTVDAETPGNGAAAKSCQKDGWRALQTRTATLFGNEGGCVSYAARGGELVARPAAALVAHATRALCGGFWCWGEVTGTGLFPGSSVDVWAAFDGVQSLVVAGVVAADGTFTSRPFVGSSPVNHHFMCLNQDVPGLPPSPVITSFYAVSTTWSGTSITSNVVATSPC